LEAWVREIKRAFEESVDKDDRRNADLQAIASAASFEDGNKMIRWGEGWVNVYKPLPVLHHLKIVTK